MTNHLSEAQARIARAQREADNIAHVVQAVGDSLASRARCIHSAIWKGTLGGLSYDGPLTDAAELLDLLPPAPLSYYRERGWAGSLKPSALPYQGKAETLEQFVDAAPWWIKASAGSWGVTAAVEWYAGMPLGLVKCELTLTDAHRWFKFWKDEIRDGRGQLVEVKPRWSHTFNHPTISLASGAEYRDWPYVTLWWPDGTDWLETFTLKE